MNRLARVALSAALLVGALSVAQLSLPAQTIACSCMAPEPGAPVFTGQEGAVIVGRVGADDGSGIFPFAVERWFKGGDAVTIRLASATQRLPDGTSVTNSCGIQLEPGSHLVLVASLDARVYTPGACQPSAQVESAEGQQLIREATATFGAGIVPGDPPPESGGGPTIDLALIATLGVLAVVVVVLFGAILAFSRRDRSATP